MDAKEATMPDLRESLWTRIKGNLPAWIVISGSLVLAVVLAIDAGPAQLATSIVTGGMWALLSVGLALIFGVMNIPHFAHGESFMVGAYVAFYVFDPLSDYLADNPNAFLSAAAPLIGILAAGVVGAILGAILERLVFSPLRRRTRSGWVMNAFLLTVGLSFILINGLRMVLGSTFRGTDHYWAVPPLEILGINIHIDRLIAFVIAMVTIGLLWFFLRRTQTGRAIRAVSQDETGAQLVGIDLSFIYTLTFSLATATAAIAGASLLFMFQAYPTVGLKPLYFAWYVVMLVGLGNVAGAIVGGFLVALFQTATQHYIGVSWEDVVPTAMMVLVLLLAPSGIFGSEVKGVQEQ